MKWPSTPVFSSYGVQKVENKTIYVEKMGIFTFSFKNSSFLKSKVYKFSLYRIPTKEEFVDFDVSVKWDTLYDTTYYSVIESTLVKVDTIVEEVANTQLKIPAGKRTYIKVTLPPNTAYLAYWIGVGQEAANGLAQMVSQIPEAAQMLGIVDPVAAFALGFLPSLFTLNRGLDISYYFLYDYENVKKFLAGENFYHFKHGIRIVTDFAKMETPKIKTKTQRSGMQISMDYSGMRIIADTSKVEWKPINQFYIGLSNDHSLITSKIVTVKMVAVRMLPKYEVKEVQKPKVQMRIVPKMD